MSGGTWLAIAIIGMLVAGTAAVGWWVVTQTAEMAIGMHGYIALALGVVATSGLGIVLGLLMRRSSRQGYDDAAGRE